MLHLLLATAFAVPVDLPHQGRLLDATGVPLSGPQALDIALYRDGTSFWTKSYTEDLDNGYFSLVLDGIDPADLETGAITVGITVGGNELVQDVLSVPFALLAARVDWDDVVGKPADLDDGDADTLASLTCSSDEVVFYDGSAFDCMPLASADWTSLANIPLDLQDGSIAWTEVTGTPAVLDDGVVDWTELANVSTELADGVVDWTEVTNTPAVLDDGEVNWLELTGVPGDLTDGDGDTLAALSCADGEGPRMNGSWGCSDLDADAIAAVSAQDVASFNGVQVGSPTAACDSGLDGTLRYTGSALDICASGTWVEIAQTTWDCNIAPDHPGCVSSSDYATCNDIKQDPLFVGGDGAYWIDPDGAGGAAPWQAWCEMDIDGGGWTMMVHQQGSGVWGSWNFDAQPGAGSSGTYVPDPTDASNFYRDWAGIAHTEILLATTDENDWLVTYPSELVCCYANAPKNVKVDSTGATNVQYRWYQRGAAQPEDPWISIGDHAGIMLYGESAYPAYHDHAKNPGGGANLFIR